MEPDLLAKGQEQVGVEEWAAVAVEAGWVVIDLVRDQAVNVFVLVAQQRLPIRQVFPAIL